MDYQTLQIARTDGYSVITLNRPDVKNALNTQLRAELLHAVKAEQGEARAMHFVPVRI